MLSKKSRLNAWVVQLKINGITEIQPNIQQLIKKFAVQHLN